MGYGFIIDNRRCIGCHACTVACKSEHNVPLGVNRTWVKYVEKGSYPETRRVFSVMRCNHCADAPCVEICPVGSLFTRKDGIVDFDSRRCIGCKACMQACPYDALYIDPETHTSAKCNYCAHRVERGMEPACVIVCPVQAIVSGDLDDPHSRIAGLLARQQVSVRKPEKDTRPKLFYIDGDQAALSPEYAPPRPDYFAAEQAAGVGHFAEAAARLGALQGATTAEAARLLGIARAEAEEAPPPGGGRRTYDAPEKGLLWSWEVSGYLWTKSVAAGVLFFPLLLQLAGWLSLTPAAEMRMAGIGLAFLALTGALLVMDLDQPWRFAYVLLRPQWRSWLTRGAYILLAFGAAATAWLALLASGTETGTAMRIVLIALGAATATYTAFLFAQARGRDLWQSPLLPVHTLLHSALAGGACWLLLARVSDGMPEGRVVPALMTALALNLGLLGIEFSLPHGSRDSRAALALLWRGALRVPFWAGVLLGNAVPLALLAAPWPWAVPAAAVLVIGFAAVSGHVWVKAPQLIPLR
jgi:Fe-S-cluster-containing dehydrogenase component/formate-dependent nitrite reductase membrane component NrfD